MSTKNNQFIYGAEGGGGAGRNYFKYSSSTGLELGAYMYLPFLYSTTLDVPLVTEINNRKNTEQYVEINGVRVYSTTSYQTTDRTTYKPYIFVMNQSGHNLEYSSIKLYYIKFYNYNDELIRDFIPVLDENNIPCLYDKISKSYFYNQGTGQFLYG